MEEQYSFIYLITNLITKKQYVGQTKEYYNKKYNGIEGRFKRHIYDALKKYNIDNKNSLPYAIKIYGETNFNIEKIKKCLSDKADYYEKYYISQYNTLHPNGYNLTVGGSHGTLCEENKRYLSEKTKEYFNNIENKKNQSIIISKSYNNKIQKYFEKEIEKVEIRNIKNNNENKLIYIIIYYKNSDKRRVRLGGIHIDYNDNLQYALNIVNKYCDKNKIFIIDNDDKLINQRNKINLLKNKIFKIDIKLRKYKLFNVIQIYSYYNDINQKSTRISTVFGGKTMSLTDIIKKINLFLIEVNFKYKNLEEKINQIWEQGLEIA